MKYEITTKQGERFGFYKQVNTPLGVNITTTIDGAEVVRANPKPAATAARNIARGISTAAGGQSGWLYRIMAACLDIPAVILIRKRGSIYYSSNRLRIIHPTDRELLEEAVNTRLMPIMVLHGYDVKQASYLNQHYRRHFETRGEIYLDGIPDSVTYKTLAPVIKQHIYKPLGLTDDVIQHRLDEFIGES